MGRRLPGVGHRVVAHAAVRGKGPTLQAARAGGEDETRPVEPRGAAQGVGVRPHAAAPRRQRDVHGHPDVERPIIHRGQGESTDDDLDPEGPVGRRLPGVGHRVVAHAAVRGKGPALEPPRAGGEDEARPVEPRGAAQGVGVRPHAAAPRRQRDVHGHPDVERPIIHRGQGESTDDDLDPEGPVGRRLPGVGHRVVAHAAVRGKGPALEPPRAGGEDEARPLERGGAAQRVGVRWGAAIHRRQPDAHGGPDVERQIPHRRQRRSPPHVRSATAAARDQYESRGEKQQSTPNESDHDTSPAPRTATSSSRRLPDDPAPAHATSMHGTAAGAIHYCQDT